MLPLAPSVLPLKPPCSLSRIEMAIPNPKFGLYIIYICRYIEVCIYKGIHRIYKGSHRIGDIRYEENRRGRRDGVMFHVVKCSMYLLGISSYSRLKAGDWG